MRQAKLLRIHIVDSDIEHQLLFRPTSRNSGSSNNSSNNPNFSSSSDNGRSSSPARGGSNDDNDEYMCGGPTISAGFSDSCSSPDSLEPHFPAIVLPSMLCVRALWEGSLDDLNLGAFGRGVPVALRGVPSLKVARSACAVQGRPLGALPSPGRTPPPRIREHFQGGGIVGAKGGSLFEFQTPPPRPPKNFEPIFLQIEILGESVGAKGAENFFGAS